MARPDRPDAAPTPSELRAPSRVPLAALAAFALVALGVAAAGLLAWTAAEQDLRARRARELASVVALKVEQVVRWREERRSDAEILAHDLELSRALETPSGRALWRAGLEAHLDRLRPIGDYTGVALVDRAGALVGAVGAPAPEPGRARALLERAVAQGGSAMSDVHGAAGGRQHVDVVAPIRSASGEPAGAVLLGVDPRPYLFRLVETWHEPSPSAEVVLVRAEGGSAVPLDASRAPPGAGRFPPGGDIASAVAARARTPIDALDHRGVPVVGAVAPVPGSPWAVVAKEDVADVLAPLRERALTLAVGVAGLLVAAGVLVFRAARRQADRLDRVRAAAAAERSALARRLARLTQHAQDMVLLADQDQRIAEANDRAVALLGYAREELIGMDVRALRDPATVDDYPERVREQVERGATMFETRFRRKDGTTFPVAVSVHTDELDGRRWFEAIARDISDRERAAQALRESEAKFRAAFEFASLGVLLAGVDGVIVETNRALRDITGYSEEELRGAPLALLHDPADVVTTADVLLDRMGGGPPDLLERPQRIRRKDGSLAETMVRVSALRDGAGAARFLLAVVEDVSEKRRLEAQLLLADRMASIGTLAAGVAHEINNPLSFILSNLDYAREELRRTGGDPEVVRALDDAKDGGVRVRQIMGDLRTFSRPVDEVRGALDVRAVLRSALGLASSEIRQRAQLVVEPGEVPPVAASEYRLGQVFLNLLVNAAQAVPEGRAADHVVRAATFTAPDGRAVVEISDTGTGISPEVLPRIFDPFFTTKPVGVGTGLGLSICHGIVTQLGGEIVVVSAPGKGSTFRVLLPAARPAAAERAPRRARILVVDDEPLVGRAVARVLAPEHDVLLRTSAREALADLRGDAAFDLLLCDLQMPEMTGMDLHARLAREAPALAARTVFLTGGAFTGAARDFLARVPNLHLEKPFDPKALRDVVARALASPPGGAPAPARA